MYADEAAFIDEHGTAFHENFGAWGEMLNRYEEELAVEGQVELAVEGAGEGNLLLAAELTESSFSNKD